METGPFYSLRSSLIVTPDGKRLYVGAVHGSSPGSSGSSIFVIDTTNNDIVTEVELGNNALTDIAVTPSGKYVYVSASPGFNPLTGGVYVIDTATNSVVDTVAKGANNFVSVGITSVPIGKQQCKNGGWKHFGFKNQGQCIQYVNKREHDERDEVRHESRHEKE